jgi:hypothetical protein
MAPPKRKRHVDIANAASEKPQDHSELGPKRQHLLLKALKAPITAPPPPPLPPPAGSQDSITRLRQDFHSESEGGDFEANTEAAKGDDIDESESEDEPDIKPLNKYLDQDIELERELAEKDQSDIEEEVIKDFEAYSNFRQSILVVESEFGYKLHLEGDIQDSTSRKYYSFDY